MLRTAEAHETKKSISKPVSVKSSVKSTLKSIYRERGTKQRYLAFEDNDKGLEVNIFLTGVK